MIKVHSCYTTLDSSEVTLRHDVVVVLVSTYTHQSYIHKYCNLYSCWTAVAWYLTDQVKSNQVLKNFATLELFSVKSWIAVNKPRTDDVD